MTEKSQRIANLMLLMKLLKQREIQVVYADIDMLRVVGVNKEEMTALLREFGVERTPSTVLIDRPVEEICYFDNRSMLSFGALYPDRE